MPIPLSPNYPRPQLQRREWMNLDGDWAFAFDRQSVWRQPSQVVFDRTIRVPFAPEAPLSGIGDDDFTCVVWYRRGFEPPPLAAGERLVLRFGAVDHKATVWVDGCFAGDHEGGYTPFGCDITDRLRPAGPHEIVVRAEDDPHDLAKPRGKQDWLRYPHSIWYPRTTGIWQTVWLETLPPWWIDTLRWTASLDTYDIGIEATVGGGNRNGLRLDIHLTVGAGDARRTLAHDTCEVVSAEVHRRIALSDPGIDDFRNELLWSPGSPTLIDAALRLLDPAGQTIDEIASYTALRQVGIGGDRFLLNGRPLPLRLVLDQGYWPDGGLTAPSVEALRRDVELAKAMGFNGVRKHQQVADPRYLFWADHLGLLVWGEMPSAYRFTKRSVQRLTAEWQAVVLRDISHPCLVTWVPFNESWGIPDLPNNPAQRDYVQALYHLTKTLDPSRPVVGNDGWESTATDIVSIHDYDESPAQLRERYGQLDAIPHLFRRVGPAGRLLTLTGHEHTGQPLVLSEFGGIAYTLRDRRDDAWGYQRVETAKELAAAYAALIAAVSSDSLLAGFCYTQFSDTYQEANGLLFADRTPKMPLETIARATRGKPWADLGEHVLVGPEIANGIDPAEPT